MSTIENNKETTKETTKENSKENNEEIDENENIKLLVSAVVGILLIVIIFAPFIYNAFFCSESLSSKITGCVLLYLTILPLSFIGIGLMFIMHPIFIALLYVGYYSIIYWKWCNSKWMFILLLLMYLVYFYFIMKTKNFVQMIFEFADNMNIDINTDMNLDNIGKNNKKKNNNNNK